MSELSSLIADLASGDDLRAERARASLSAHGPAALPALVRLAQSPDRDSRWWAVRCLSDQPHLGADQLLVKALDDPDLTVRQAAALGLRDRPMVTAIPRLVDLLGSEDSLLSRLAADALSAMGSVATPALAETLHSSSAIARIAATRALALNQDPGAIAALYTALEDASSLVEYWATDGLERRGLGMVYFLP